MKELYEILGNYHKTIAFVIGNGVNYHFSNENAISWLGLLEELWSKCSNDSNADFSKIRGLPYTELYDIIELRYGIMGTVQQIHFTRDIRRHNVCVNKQ